MRLPDTDTDKDPWSGAAIDSGRNLPDETPIDENVSLMPALGKTPAEIGAELTEPLEPEELLEDSADEGSDRDWMQFSIGDVLILMAAAGASLGTVRFLPPAIFALLAGGATVLFLMIARESQISRPRFRTIVLGLITIYLVGIISAIVRSVWAT